MRCAANEHGQTESFNPSDAVQRAHGLLGTALTSSRDDIKAVASQFETLSTDIQSVLNLTSDVVNCVKEDWVQSIVPMTQVLASSARRFIEERIESLAAIGDVFAGEATMLEDLLTLTAEQRSIAREAKALSILASIEVARLTTAERRFEYMAHELDEFSTMISSGAGEVRIEAGQRRKTLIDRGCKLKLTLQRRTRYFEVVEAELNEAIVAMDSVLRNFARIPADFSACVSLIAVKLARVVEAVQVQDITRQQIEHVRTLLSVVHGELENSGNAKDDKARQYAILKVQAMQVQSACASTREWIDEVSECLGSILRVGTSDVLAVGRSILEQERALSLQLKRIGELEQECASDDMEIDASLAGIGELMRITNSHLARSREARDRMKLLNFNSMIEARYLGSQTSAVLEITRNIGRISNAWSDLTERSGNTLEAILSASSRAEETHRTRVRLSRDELMNASRESSAGLAALSRAAVVVDSSGEKVRAAVTQMQDQSATLARISGRLAEAIVLMEDARVEIMNASGQVEPCSLSLPVADRKKIEEECKAIYSCELERQILRAALDGEAMPLHGAAVVGNDVELF